MAAGTVTAPQARPKAGAAAAWLAGVRLRAARRVLWLRQLWSGHDYADEHLLAISHSEVDRALTSKATAADAERAFYGSDERAKDLTAQIAALGRDPRLDHLVATFGLPPLDTAILTLAMAGAADQSIGRVYGYLLDGTARRRPDAIARGRPV